MSVASGRMSSTIETVSVPTGPSKQMFECVAHRMRESPDQDLNICSIEGMFGTQLRIRSPGRDRIRAVQRLESEERQMSTMVMNPTVVALPRLRLTPRGRAVFGTLAAIPLVLLALALGVGAPSADAHATPRKPKVFNYEYKNK